MDGQHRSSLSSRQSQDCRPSAPRCASRDPAFGFLPPIWGAIGQELIDLLAVLNAVRVALPTDDLQDYEGE